MKSIISVPVLAAADPSKYSAAADELQQLADAFAQASSGFDHKVLGPLPAAWSGSAADSAIAALTTTSQGLSATHDYLVRFIGLLREAATGITEAQACLEAGTKIAASVQLSVLPDGEVAPAPGSTIPPECTDASEEARQLIERAIATAEAVNDPIAEAMEDPEQFGHGAWIADAARESAAAQSLAAGIQRAAVPAIGSNPVVVGAWWNALPKSIQAELVDTMPAAIGPLAGIPAAARDTANRSLLADDLKQEQALQASLNTQQTKIEAEIARLNAQGEGHTAATARDGELPTNAMLNLDNQLRAVQTELGTVNFKLAGLQSLQQGLAAHPKPGSGANSNANPAAYLLSFDTQGQGHSVVSLGDPDTATDIAINVMGTGTNLTSTAGNLQRAFAVQHSAQGGVQGGSVASILWQGYDAPQSLVDAAFQHYANTAAPLLADFEKQIAAVDPTSHITVIGHSYGSTVVGEAAANYGMHPGDLVFIGSPGVGVNNVQGLHMSSEHVWTGDAADDPVPWSPPVDLFESNSLLPAERYGIDPSSIYFGGQRFKVAAGPGYLDPSVHSDYWQGISLDNMGEIVAGRYGYVKTQPEEVN